MPAKFSKLNIFISWSGAQSEEVGQAFSSLLPDLFDGIDTFISGADIDKGTRWSHVLSTSLKSSSCGIVCLTPESLQSTWVAFEIGAISKAAGGAEAARNRIWTYIVGLERSELAVSPFAEYQATNATQKDTFRLVESINGLSPNPVTSATLKKRYDQVFWPPFSKHIEHARSLQPSELTNRSKESLLLAEILNSVTEIRDELRRAPKQLVKLETLSSDPMNLESLSLIKPGEMSAQPIDLKSDPLTRLIAHELGARGHFYDNLRITRTDAGGYDVKLGRLETTVTKEMAVMVVSGQVPPSVIVNKMSPVTVEPVRQRRRRD